MLGFFKNAHDDLIVKRNLPISQTAIEISLQEREKACLEGARKDKPLERNPGTV